MRALLRALMVPVSFVLFLALFAAVAVAVVAAGPILIEGLKPEALPTLIPQGGAKPSPYVIAAGVAVVDALLIGMIAMLVSEKVFTVGRFVRSLVKTAIWFAVLTAGPCLLAARPGGRRLDEIRPAILLAAGLIAAAIVTGIVLGKPFLWWVSERPPVKKRRQRPSCRPRRRSHRPKAPRRIFRTRCPRRFLRSRRLHRRSCRLALSPNRGRERGDVLKYLPQTHRKTDGIKIEDVISALQSDGRPSLT